MEGQTCMVTGSNSGIGKVIATEAARMGATVVMVCRNRERGEEALKEIRQKTRSDKIQLILADLSSQMQIRQLANDFTNHFERLDVLVNNAGTIFRERSVTEDGYESTFAVNHLGPFMLTGLLLDTLKASAPARIVNVGSHAHKMTNFSLDEVTSNTKKYKPFRVYAGSKLANLCFTYDLAEKLEGTGVTVNCVHPGAVATGMLNHGPKWLAFILALFFLTPEKGAETAIELMASPDYADATGHYYYKKKKVKSSPRSHDLAFRKELWQKSCEWTGVYY